MTTARLIERIAIHESKHGDVAAKVLRSFDALRHVDADKVVSRIAALHGVPKEIVPAALHRIGAEDEEHRLGAASTWSQRKQRGDALHRFAHAYAAGDPSHILRSDMEATLDHVRQWHHVATHPQGQHALHLAYLSGVPGHGVDEGDRAAVAAAVAQAPKDDHGKLLAAAHAVLSARRAAYNPMSSRTWSPTTLDLHADPVHKAHMAHLTPPGEGGMPHDVSVQMNAEALIGEAHAHLMNLHGLKPSIPPVAEHTTADGTKFRAYTLDTPAKADDRCWGSRYCISTAGHAEGMNKMYHGGVYKPVHLITKVGADGQERLHAAYLPELLRGSAVRPDPEQAVRNSANNGPVHGDAFHKIHPLLSKLDGRIDDPVAHQPYVA